MATRIDQLSCNNCDSRGFSFEYSLRNSTALLGHPSDSWGTEGTESMGTGVTPETYTALLTCVSYRR